MKNKNARGYLYVFLAGVCWGTIGIFTNGLSALNLDSIEISLLRQFWAFIVLIPIVLIKSGRKALKLDKKSLLILLVLGCVVEAAFNIAYTLAIQKLGVASAVVLLYTSPIFVTILSAIFFSEKPTVVKVFALVLDLLGSILTVTGGNFSVLSFGFLGVVYGLISGLTYALVTVVGKLSTDNVDSFVTTFYMSFFSTIVLAIITFARGFDASVMFSTSAVLYGLGDGVMATVVPYLLYFTGIGKGINMPAASVIASVEVAVGAMVGFLIFNESVGFVKLLGIVLVLGSIVIMNLSVQKNGSKES